jgi:multiple antibiotic resistance protein
VRSIISFSLLSLSAIFIAVDPFAAVPMFLAMTEHDSITKRRQMALRASVTAFAVLTAFAVAGAVIFKALGITMAAFKVAGGLLLLIMSMDMLRTQPSAARITPGEVDEGTHKEDIAIVPLAIPLLAGPGSIATVVVLMGKVKPHHQWQIVPILLAILITCLGSYLVLRGASQVARVLGRTGLSIVSRIAGLLLAAVAAQFILDGVGEALPLLRKAR